MVYMEEKQVGDSYMHVEPAFWVAVQIHPVWNADTEVYPLLDKGWQLLWGIV